MALLEILKFPDPRLRKKSNDVKTVTSEHKKFIENMLETMYSFNGIGLAAPQVDRLERMVVIDTRRPADDEGDEEEAVSELRYELGDSTELESAIEQPLVIINPEIVGTKGSTTYDEGCLSVPSYYETVERHDYIELKYLDINGKEQLLKTDGLLSICIQHEIDHLDGKLFIDRLSPIKANRIKSKIKKHGYPDPQDSSSQD